MMDNQVKEKFIELRAQGLSFAKIAEQLGVSKPTLIEWSRELEHEISNLKAIELETLHEKYYVQKAKRIELLGRQLEAVKGELEKRDLKEMPTEKLLDFFIKFATVLKQEETAVTFQGRRSIIADNPFIQVEAWGA